MTRFKAAMICAAVCAGLTATPVAAQHAHGDSHGHAAHPGPKPVEGGQAAFAAIQEVVALLEADPATDWSRVDVEALRRHLTDMDAVTLRAQVTAIPMPGGARFEAIGDAATAASVRRMLTAHAATMDGADDWRFVAETIPGGAALTVTGPDVAAARKIVGLGLIGVMARGMHHQAHHLMIARGDAPHR